MGVQDRNKAIIFNGRVIGPLDDDEEFTFEDFSLLERFSQSTYGNKLFKNLLEDEEDDGKFWLNKFLLMAELRIYFIYLL